MKQLSSQQLIKLGKKISIINILFYVVMIPFAIFTLLGELLELSSTLHLLLSTIVIVLGIAELILLCLLIYFQRQLKLHLDHEDNLVDNKDTKDTK